MLAREKENRWKCWLEKIENNWIYDRKKRKYQKISKISEQHRQAAAGRRPYLHAVGNSSGSSRKDVEEEMIEH